MLKRPDIVLHINASEGDLRCYVKWCKNSGGTRSEPGKRCRDGFASLKQTCRKPGISSWDSLGDRLAHTAASAHCPIPFAGAPQRRARCPELLRRFRPCR